MKRLSQQLLSNIFIALLVFSLSIKLHSGGFFYDLGQFGPPALAFYSLHFFISLFNRKYEYKEKYSYLKLVSLYTRCWLYTSGLVLLFLVTFQINWVSRQVLLTNIFGLLAGEMAIVSYIRLLRKSVLVRDAAEIEEDRIRDISVFYPATSNQVPPHLSKQGNEILNVAGVKVHDFVARHFDLKVNHTLVLNENSRFALHDLPTDYYRHNLNFHKLKNNRYHSKFHKVT